MCGPLLKDMEPYKVPEIILITPGKNGAMRRPMPSINTPDFDLTLHFVPLYIIMNADAYSCQYRSDINGVARDGRTVMNLNTIPENIVEYVKQRLPNLDPIDWWWMPRSNEKSNWIELSITSRGLRKHKEYG